MVKIGFRNIVKSNKILLSDNTSVLAESSKRAGTNIPFRQRKGQLRMFSLDDSMCCRSIFIEMAVSTVNPSLSNDQMMKSCLKSPFKFYASVLCTLTSLV